MRARKPLVAPLPLSQVSLEILSPTRSARVPSEDCFSAPFDDLDEDLMKSVFLTDQPEVSSEPNLLVQAELLGNRTYLPAMDFSYERAHPHS